MNDPLFFTNVFNGTPENIGHLLEEQGRLFELHERFGKSVERFLSSLVMGAVFMVGVGGGFESLRKNREFLFGNFGIWPGIGLFDRIVVFGIFRRLSRGNWSIIGIRIEEIRDEIGKFVLTLRLVGVEFLDAFKGCKEVIDRSGEADQFIGRDIDPFLDTFGNLELAFAGQQFNRTHFPHVHAHWIRSAAQFRVDGRDQCGGNLGSFLLIVFGNDSGFRDHVGIRPILMTSIPMSLIMSMISSICSGSTTSPGRWSLTSE